MLSIIAAIGKNNELGKKNALLWSLPADMEHFRNTTRGHTVVMGKKTFESIGHPLPNRRNIVITRDETFAPEGVEISKSLEDTLRSLEKAPEEIFIIGGGEIYKQTIDKADKLYITHVEASFPDADIFFPIIDPAKWQEISREKHQKDERNPFTYVFVVYKNLR